MDMKKSIIYTVVLLAAAACQPHFDMVPPGDGVVITQEFTENWYVSQEGSGVKNGSDWNNALPFEDFLRLISNPASALSDAGIHIKEGVYLVTEKDKYLNISKDILCIRGGYRADLSYDDVSACDPKLYPTVFTGDVDGNGTAGDGDGAFAYVTDGSVRFENITFTNFYQSAAMAAEIGGKGSAVFGINGPYLTTSVECNNCIFEGNVNGVSASAQDGGPCAFVTQGYFKARNCVFRNNSANSRGGAIRTCDKKGVLYLDRCLFTGNKLTGSTWGSAIQCSAGVICANNCTMVGNTGAGSTLNGGGAFFLANTTIIDGSAANGTNNGAFRCESKQECKTTIINSVFSNSDNSGHGICLNGSSSTLISRGFNVLKSVNKSDGVTDPTVKEDLVKDIVLAGELKDNCWVWDIAQVEADLKGYAVADEIYDAAVAFDPSAYCEISVLGRAFATWVSPTSFAIDGRGSSRGDDGLQPGSYDPNLDE